MIPKQIWLRINRMNFISFHFFIYFIPIIPFFSFYQFIIVLPATPVKYNLSYIYIYIYIYTSIMNVSMEEFFVDISKNI